MPFVSRSLSGSREAGTLQFPEKPLVQGSKSALVRRRSWQPFLSYLNLVTDEAREAVGDLADSAADWTNENIEELNSLTARLSWLIDQLAPILDDAVELLLQLF